MHCRRQRSAYGGCFPQAVGGARRLPSASRAQERRAPCYGVVVVLGRVSRGGLVRKTSQTRVSRGRDEKQAGIEVERQPENVTHREGGGADRRPGTQTLLITLSRPRLRLVHTSPSVCGPRRESVAAAAKAKRCRRRRLCLSRGAMLARTAVRSDRLTALTERGLINLAAAPCLGVCGTSWKVWKVWQGEASGERMRCDAMRTMRSS